MKYRILQRRGQHYVQYRRWLFPWRTHSWWEQKGLGLGRWKHSHKSQAAAERELEKLKTKHRRAEQCKARGGVVVHKS